MPLSPTTPTSSSQPLPVFGDNWAGATGYQAQENYDQAVNADLVSAYSYLTAGVDTYVDKSVTSNKLDTTAGIITSATVTATLTGSYTTILSYTKPSTVVGKLLINFNIAFDYNGAFNTRILIQLFAGATAIRAKPIQNFISLPVPPDIQIFVIAGSFIVASTPTASTTYDLRVAKSGGVTTSTSPRCRPDNSDMSYLFLG